MFRNNKGIGNLSSFLITKIFSFLDISSLKAVSFVCYDWRFLSNPVWESIVKQRVWIGRDDTVVWKDYYSYRLDTGLFIFNHCLK